MENTDPYLELAKKYPSILMRSVYTGKLTEYIGCELAVGHGWLPIIDDLCSKLEKVIEPLSEDERSCFYATQVKEKFGGLRFYTTFGNDEIYDLIRDAEKKSYITCEVCGEPGEERDSGWIQTLCDAHNAK
jgi:hypothetical protein